MKLMRIFWLDPWLYVSAIFFLLLLLSLFYFIKKYRDAGIEMKNGAAGAGGNAAPETSAAALDENASRGHEGGGISSARASFSSRREDNRSGEPADSGEGSAVAGGEREQRRHFEKAEAFLRGIHDNIKDLDERIRGLEKKLSEQKLNGEFALKMVEEILEEYDSLEKEEIRKRISVLAKSLRE